MSPAADLSCEVVELAVLSKRALLSSHKGNDSLVTARHSLPHSFLELERSL